MNNADKDKSAPAGDETIDLTEIINQVSEPNWRESPHTCLIDSASDPLDAILLQQLQLLDAEAANCFSAADSHRDPLRRSQYINHADAFLDHIVEINMHRSKYQNYGRQEILLEREEAKAKRRKRHSAPTPEPRQRQNENVTNELGKVNWREAPRDFLGDVAKSPSEVIILQYVYRFDVEIHRCLRAIDSCSDPDVRMMHIKLIQKYSRRILSVAEGLRKGHCQGKQHILIKREVVTVPMGRSYHSAARRSRRNAPTRAKRAQAV